MTNNKMIEEEAPEVFQEDDDVLVDVDNESIASVESSVAETSLAKRETQVVSVFRIILIVLLMATAFAVSLTSYVLSMKGEQDDFAAAFEGHALKVRRTLSLRDTTQRAVFSVSHPASLLMAADHRNL